GKSFRSKSNSELIRWGEQSCSVHAAVQDQHTEFELGLIIENNLRRGLINGQKAKSISSYLGRLACVTFSPSDLEIIKGGPAERRSFIDRHIIELDPQMIEHYVNFNRALRSKSKILGEPYVTPDMLRSWNKILSDTGVRIYLARIGFLQEITKEANRLHAEFAKEDGTLELSLISSVATAAQRGSEALLEFYEEHARNEIYQRRCLYGPQRDEIEIKFNAIDSRAFASQGQSRSLVLSLKLAVIQELERVRGESPVILLDDVDAELDAARGQAFFRMILNESRQVFITATDAHVVELCKLGKPHLMEVVGGRLSEASI
ncbi:MAG: DNA replication and repair protein RecF, partial [Bdellovibrionales bacterium]|nr:DNA replication and repair protein RecF [Bdellovibrionales bacterium]